MQKDVIISIIDSHEVDGESMTAELMTTGTLTGDGERYSIVYTEQDEEMKDCVTTLMVEAEKMVTMTRIGSYNTRLILEKGKRHNCHYITPQGELFMGVYTNRITSKMKESGGELEFNYTIDFNSGYASTNELKVTVKEAGGNVCVS